MALPRESRFLPTIKCSNCGNEVEISLMGEHLCGAPVTPELSPPLESEETFESAYQATRNKHLRTPPPVDTGAANQYCNHGQLTPVSQAGSSRNTSPKTPSGRLEISRKFNDDFAPKIASQDDGRRPGGYGGFGSQISEHDVSDATDLPAKETSGFFQRINNIAGSYGGFGSRPAEPEKPAGKIPTEAPGILKRLNDIAGASFDAGRRPSPPNEAEVPQRKESLDRWDLPPDLAVPSKSLPKPSRQNSDGGLSGATRNRIGMICAETFPRRAYPGNDMSGQRPSEPGQQQADVNRRPSAPYQRPSDMNRNPSRGPDTSRRPPPRTSLIKQHANSSIDLDAEFGVRNPYHTPSVSISSGYSSMSEHSTKASSRGSAERSMEKRESDISNRARQQQLPRLPQPESTSAQRPKLHVDSAVQGPMRSTGRLVESPYSASPRDDIHDPAIQHGLAALRERPGLGGGNDQSDRYGTRAPSSSASARPGSRDGVPARSRGDCKACRLPITGKSISSADGRLTGKYHKACFVCTTCAEPFPSAEFYVHRDRPYCDVHYHKLNGSLCGGCKRGIEGQYLEDEARVKYHVGCFRCFDCGMSLPDGYFEVDGKSYCERDAWRRAESGAGDAPLSTSPPPPPPAKTQALLGADVKTSTSPNAGGEMPPPRLSIGRGRGMGAGMERGPYGVVPGSLYSEALGSRGDRPRPNKRTTRLGIM